MAIVAAKAETKSVYRDLTFIWLRIRVLSHIFCKRLILMIFLTDRSFDGLPAGPSGRSTLCRDAVMQGAFNLRLKGRKFHFRRNIPYTLRERFGRYELVLSLRTSERRQAMARARQVWLAVEQVIEKVRNDVTLTHAEIDRLVARAAQAIDWANEVHLARTEAVFDCIGSVPPDADVDILKTYADEYRQALAENDMTPVRSMVQRYASDLDRPILEESTDERLLSRALLRLLADKSEAMARQVENEVYKFRRAAVDRPPLSCPVGKLVQGWSLHQR
jgi:hypothetical protein